MYPKQILFIDIFIFISNTILTYVIIKNIKGNEEEQAEHILDITRMEEYVFYVCLNQIRNVKIGKSLNKEIICTIKFLFILHSFNDDIFFNRILHFFMFLT